MNIKKYTGFEYRFGVSLMLLVLIGFYFTLGDSWILPRFSFKSRPGKMEIETERVAKLSVPFKVDISVDTDGQSVNAVGAFVRFDPQKLQLIDMDTSKSFCQYYPERKFDNGLGTVSLSCGSPHPGFSGTQTVMTL